MSTAKKYAYAQATFAGFCSALGTKPVPCSRATILRYLVWLKCQKGLGGDAINGHVSAIRHLHLINGAEFEAIEDPRFPLAKRAVCKRDKPADDRIPIGYGALSLMFLGDVKSTAYDDLLFFTGALMAYCGFLRVSELCGKGGTQDAPGIRLRHLNLVDGTLRIAIEHSKTDRQNQGAYAHLTALKGNPCPMVLLKKFLSARPPTERDSPLFIHQDRTPMSAVWFRKLLKQKCEKTGICGKVNTHSLRIGAASDAAAKGVAAHTIKTLGRWKSDSFQRYIRPSGASMASTLTTFATL